MTTLRKLSLLLPAAALSTGLASHTAAQENYEWEPGTGTHEEEWYDPTDWFDDDADAEYGSDIDYEETGNDYTTDTYDYRYGTTYDDDSNYNDDTTYGYTDEYGYDAEDYRQRNNNTGMTRNRMNNGGTDDGYLLYFYETQDGNRQQNRQMQQDRQRQMQQAQAQRDRQRGMQQSPQTQPQQRDSRQMQQRQQAQNQQDRQRQMQQDQQRQMDRQARRPGAELGTADQWGQQQIVEGRLMQMTDVNLQGVPDSHRLVKLERADGMAVVVDLGMARDFADFDIEQDDYLIVFGETGQIDGKKVIFARHVAEVNTIDRSDRADRARRGDQGSQQSRR